jgi:predicted metal-dependent peptidase
MSDTERILHELSQAGIALLLREPFFAHLLGSINKEVVGREYEVQTLAVGQGKSGFTLYVNSYFWDNTIQKPELRYGILKHEMLHLVFRHLNVQEPRLNAMLLNVAFDLVVNQYIDKSQLLEDSLFLESFPELTLKPGQTWFYYYQKIAELHRQAGSGQDADRPGYDLLQQMRGDSHGLDRHQPWNDLSQRLELEQAVTEVHLDSLLRQARQRTGPQAWGNLPGEIQDALSKLSAAPAEISWKAVLRLFMGYSGKTKIRNTIKRASKRYGTTPGNKVRRMHRLLVAVDTSGSIAQADLDTFFREIYFLWRAGALFEVVECDTKIGGRYAYKGQPPRSVYGRGGTDFNAPLQLANEERPDGLIYFTDGYGYTPVISCRVPVLWVLTGNGLGLNEDAARKLPGRKIKMG